MIGGSGANGSVGPPAATAFSVHQQLTEANRLFQQSSYQAAAAGVVSPFSGHIPSHHGSAAAALQQHHHHQQQQHAAAAAVAAGQHQTQQQQHNAAAVAAAAVAAMGQSSHTNLSQLTHGLSNASQSLAAFFATAPLLPDNLKLAAAAAAAAAAAQSSRSKKCHRAEPLPQSGFKGVSWNSRMKAWLAFYVTENGERKSKTFSTRKLGMEEARVQAISFCKQKQDQRRERKRTRELQQQQQSQQQHCNNSGVGSISGDNAGASSPSSQQAAAAAAAAVAAMRCGYSTTPTLNNGSNVGASSSSMAPLLGQGGAGSGNRDGIMSNQGTQSSSMASSGGPEIAYVPIVPIAMHMIQKSGLLQPLELNELPPCQHCNKQPYPFLMIVSEGQEQTYSSSSIISLSSTTVSPSAASSSSAHGRPEGCTRESSDGLTGPATSDRLTGAGAGVGSGLIGSPRSGNPTPSTCDSGTPHSTSNSAGSILPPMSETPTRGDVSSNGTARVLHHGGSSLAVNRSSRQQNHCLLPSPTGSAQQQPVASGSGTALSPHTTVSPRTVILLNNGQAGHGEKGEQRQQQRLSSEMSLENGPMNHRKEDLESGGTEARGQALCRMTGTGSYMPGNGLHASSVLSASSQQHRVAVKEADEGAYCDPTMVMNFSADQHDPQQQHHHHHHHHMVNNGGNGGVPGATKGGHLSYSSTSQCMSSDPSSHAQRGGGNTLSSSETSGPYAQHQQYLRDSLLRNELDEDLPSVSAAVSGLTMSMAPHHGGSSSGLSLYETPGAATPRAVSSSINQHPSSQSQGCDVASGIDETVDITGGLSAALGNGRDTSGHCGDASIETAKNGAPLFLHGNQHGHRHHHHGSSAPGPPSSSSSSAMDRGSVNPVPPNPGGYHHLRLEAHQPAPSHAHHLCDTTANSQTSGPESIDLHGSVVGLLHHKRHQPHHPHHSRGISSHPASSTSLAQHLQQGHYQNSNSTSSISFHGGHHSNSGNSNGGGSSVDSEASGPLSVVVPHERTHGSGVVGICHSRTRTILGEGNAPSLAPAPSPLQATSSSSMSSPSSSSGAGMGPHVYPDASASSSPSLLSQQQQQSEVLRSQHPSSQSQSHHQQQVPSSSAAASPCCHHASLQQSVHHGGVYSPHHQAMPVVSASSPSPSPSLLSPEDCALGAHPGPTLEQGHTLLHSAPSSPIRQTQPVGLFSPATVGEQFSKDPGGELTGKKETYVMVTHETSLSVGTAEATCNRHAPLSFKRTSTGEGSRLLEYPNLEAPLSVSLLSPSSTSSSAVGVPTNRIVSSPSSSTILSSSTCHAGSASVPCSSVSALSQQPENHLSVSSGMFSSIPLDTTCPVDMSYVCSNASTEPTPLVLLKSEPSCSIRSTNSKESLDCSALRGSGCQPNETSASPSMSSPLMVTASESPSSYGHQTCISANATRFIPPGSCESFSSASAEPEITAPEALLTNEESAKKDHLHQLHSHHHLSVHSASSTALRSNIEGALTAADTTATAPFGELLNTADASQASLCRPASHGGVERGPTSCSYFDAQDAGSMKSLCHGIRGSQHTHVDESMPGELKAET